MELPGGLKLLHLFGLLCKGVGVFFHLFAVASNNWSEDGESPTLYYGLWNMCVDNVCFEYKTDFITASLRACQAFAIIGIVIGVLMFLTGLVYVCMHRLELRPQKLVPMIAMFACVTSFVSILICVVTWAKGLPVHREVEDYGFSFVLSMIGGIFIATGGMLFFFGSE